MIHRPWPFTDRLVAKMADSSTQGTLVHNSQRSGGLHASTLLREIHKRKRSDITEDELAIYGLLGLAFEDRAERALVQLSKQEDWPWQSFRPGEVVSEEGIICSPDILMVPKPAFSHLPIRELSLKCTWKSAAGWPREEGENAFAPKFGYYLDQCLGYGTPLDTEGAFIVCYFVRADYKKFAPSPEILGNELDWSVQERNETWDQLIAIAAES